MDPYQLTEDDKLIPINEVARMLSVSIETLRRWERQGKITSYRLSPTSRRRYKLSDIRAMLHLNNTPVIQNNEEVDQ